VFWFFIFLFIFCILLTFVGAFTHLVLAIFRSLPDTAGRRRAQPGAAVAAEGSRSHDGVAVTVDFDAADFSSFFILRFEFYFLLCIVDIHWCIHFVVDFSTVSAAERCRLLPGAAGGCRRFRGQPGRRALLGLAGRYQKRGRLYCTCRHSFSVFLFVCFIISYAF